MTADTIGVDIAKDKLDVHRVGDGAFAQFPNTPRGFTALRRWIGDTLPTRVVYEPTGAYHGAFEAALADHLPLIKVNPKHARRFAESRGAGAKTDRAEPIPWHRWARRMVWPRIRLRPKIALFSESCNPPVPHW